MSDINFKIDEKNRVVVCKLSNCKWNADDRIRKYDGDSYTDNYLISDIFTGVARCNPQDEFNEEIGKKIALTRAKAKRCKAINNTIRKYIKDQERVIENLKKYAIHEIPEFYF